MNTPPGNDPRTSKAPLPGGAFGETLLADPVRARTAIVEAAAPERATAAPRSMADALRSLPVAIQGAWVGIVCIVLLVGSAAALRSMLVVAPGVAPSVPAPPSTTAPAIGSAPAKTVAATSAPPTASSPGSSSSLAIGGPAGGQGMGGFGALGIRDRLPGHVRLRKIGPFIDDLERLLEIEPSAIDRADVRKMVADAATYVMVPGVAGAFPPEAERLFSFLTGRAGPAGPDILFDLVTTRGGSRAASYAEELLKREEVRAKGTPAFKIAYDLRAGTTCQARIALFERVKADGDRRVLASLFQMAKCGKGSVDCCLSTDPAYKEVVRVINAKK